MYPELLVLLVLTFGVRVVNVSRIELLGDPVVTFTPNWDTVFTGDNIRITCEIKSKGYLSTPSDNRYNWYKDNKALQHPKEIFVIQSLKITDSGNYQCRQSSSHLKSDPASLQVSDGWVILQGPLHIHEREDLRLRCAHYPGYSARRTIFYKDNTVIRDWGFKDELHIGNTSLERSGRYKCIKEVYRHLLYYQYSGEASVSVKEIFTPPEIETDSPSVLKGERVYIECKTRVSLLRLKKEIHFAFYRNGQNIQNFSSDDFYLIESIQLKDSGNYSCIAKVDGIIKRSKIFQIDIHSSPVYSISTYIWTLPGEKIVGDHIKLQCKKTSNTWNVEQYFAFYKDGENIQNFSGSNQYEVPFAEEEDSGNYSCEVKIPSRNETERSEEVYVHIQGPKIRRYENSAFYQNIPWLVLSGCVLASLLSCIT